MSIWSIHTQLSLDFDFDQETFLVIFKVLGTKLVIYGNSISTLDGPWLISGFDHRFSAS